jgi:hypothetical protein
MSGTGLGLRASRAPNGGPWRSASRPSIARCPPAGLALGAVHEITEQGTDGARASLSALFAAGILARLPGAGALVPA